MLLDPEGGVVEDRPARTAHRPSDSELLPKEVVVVAGAEISRRCSKLKGDVS